MKRLLLAALILMPLGASAHEIGTTQVRFALHQDQTWSASITTGPHTLVNKLEVEARLPRSSDLGADALRAKLNSFGQSLAQHIDVRFDGSASPASIAISSIEAPADVSLPSFVVLVATGAIPDGAQAVTWRYSLAYSTYALTFVAKEDSRSPVTLWIDGDQASRPLPVFTNENPPSRIEVIAQYLRLGFLHILPHGFDHILFVLGLFLLTTKLRPLLVQVTAFTVAHSVTLALTMYGIVSLPPRIVEPLIALSVAYVAIENIATPRLSPWRPAVIFGFGLLHGMGFADALTELRLPSAEFIPALVSFNVGIELGQLSVIAIAFLAVAAWHRDKWWYRARFAIPGSAAIAAMGLFWTVQRTFGF